MIVLSRLIAVSVTLAVSAFTAGAAVVSGDTLRLSRNECVEIALQDNRRPSVLPTSRSSAWTIPSARCSPTFSQTSISQGSFQRTIKLQTISMNMGGHTQQFKMGTDNNWNFGLSASMPLVNAALWKSIQISDTQILASLEEARASRLDLVNNINKAYYALTCSPWPRAM